MDYRHRYQIIIFVCYYLCAVCFFVMSAVAAGSTAEAYILFVVAMALCYFIVNFKLSHKRKAEKDPNRERRSHMTVFGAVLVAAVFFQQPDEVIEGRGLAFILGELLLFVLIMAITAVYIYADYFREKYFTMHANPCVNTKTIRRFEKNTRYALKRFLFFFGFGALMLFCVVSSIVTTEVDYKYEKQEERQPRQSVQRVRPKKEQQEQIQEQEKEKRSPFMELLLRILMRVMQVIVILFFVIGVAAILFFLLRKIFRVRLPQFSRVEKVRERHTDGIDEYISLRPVLRQGEEFPADPNGKIRRYFTRYMKRKSGGRVDISLTPKEMVKMYAAGEGGNVTEEERVIVELYEKARYSGENCSEEEAERVRRGSISGGR